MPLRPGDFIGAYEIIAPLGQGGMATVYRAYHARLNRHVAIKMIHQVYLDDHSFLARFEREAQIVAALEHPNIVPVYDFSEHNGEPYLVMKLIEGTTLKATLANGPLRVEDIIAIASPIAQALDYAHRKGVLHRDVKPSNIMLDAEMAPYLTDFGLARIALAGDSTISKDSLMGTPYYIAPEQALGNSEIDHRADLYSFGVVLYELFVGKVPFSSGTPYSIINDHIYQPLPLPSTLNGDIPPAVELVLLKALAKDADDRYPSATAMVDELRATLSANAPQLTLLSEGRQSIANSVISQRTNTPSVTPTKPIVKAAANSRRKLWLWLGGVLAILSPVAIIVVLLSVLQTPPAPATATPPPNSAVPALYNVPTLSLADARAAVASDPNNPESALALVRAQLVANDIVGARRTIADGLLASSDDARFELTAANLAAQVGRYDAAYLIYSDVLVRAHGTDAYPAVRANAGQYLYLAATSVNRLTAGQMIELNRELQNTTSPIVSTMIGRAFLENGNMRLAQTSIGKALATDAALAEAHLVNGELQHQQGNNERARAEWERANSAIDAPRWVRERANQLINNLT